MPFTQSVITVCRTSFNFWSVFRLRKAGFPDAVSIPLSKDCAVDNVLCPMTGNICYGNPHTLVRLDNGDPARGRGLPSFFLSGVCKRRYESETTADDSYSAARNSINQHGKNKLNCFHRELILQGLSSQDYLKLNHTAKSIVQMLLEPLSGLMLWPFLWGACSSDLPSPQWKTFSYCSMWALFSHKV